jgi:glycosyltransferase involved in cell wall biosynthesis
MQQMNRQKSLSKTIYYVCAVDISKFDGQRTHILEVVSAWHRAGVDVTLFLPQFSAQRESLSFSHQYLSVRIGNNLKFIEYEIRLGFSLFRSIIKKRPDVIYIRKGFLTIFPVFLSRLFSIKCVLEVNGLVGEEVYLGHGFPAFVSRIFAIPEWITYRLTDKIITVTDGLKQVICNMHNIDEARIRVISNGVNTERFKPVIREEDGIIYLGYIGNLVPWSGLDYMLRSLPLVIREYPQLKFLIVGTGRYMSYLKDLATELEINQQIIFTGSVPSAKVPEYITRCHICYLPARRLRNARIGISPLKIYEYLACGIPVIVTDINGLEFITTQGVGLVVEPESSSALTKATIELLGNPELRSEMSRKGRKLVEKEFSWEKISADILNVIQTMNKKNISY